MDSIKTKFFPSHQEEISRSRVDISDNRRVQLKWLILEAPLENPQNR